MQKPMKTEPEDIVSYFERRMPIQAFRAELRETLPRYKVCVFDDRPQSTDDPAAIVMLDLLATYKCWFGYLDDVWPEFEKYIREDVCQTATYRELRSIYNKVVGT